MPLSVNAPSRGAFILSDSRTTVRTCAAPHPVESFLRRYMNWLGHELLKVDKYDCAIAVFGQVVTENPSSAEAYDNLGEAYLQKGEKKNAISAFQHAVDLGLKDPDVRRKLSGLCKQERCSKRVLN
jgi:Flp pilus assembly protein TadD